MYLEEVNLNFIQPCTTDSLRIRIQGLFSKDISDIFPYLNSYLNSAMYNKKSNTIAFNKEHKIITMYSDRVNISKLLNETEAFEVLDYLKDIINEVDSKRKEIEPSFELKKLPSPLEIYNYLPKLNCKKCGKATCLAFATNLIHGDVNMKKCLHLYEKGNEANMQKIEDIVLMLGYEI